MAETSESSGLRGENNVPVSETVISAKELPIFQQAALNNAGVTVLVLAKEGEDYLPTKPTWVEAETTYKGSLTVKPGEMYIQICSRNPDIGSFWADVERLKKESAKPKK